MIARRRMTLEEYERLPEPDGLTVPRTELFRGVVYTMSPQNPDHADCVTLCNDWLVSAFRARYWIRVQLPLVILSDSMPEPDFSTVPRTPLLGRERANSALAVVEVSDSTLKHDRMEKGPAYAEAGIPEYWMLNLVDHQIDIYRNPALAGYRSQSIHFPDDETAFLFAPENRVRV